RELAGHRVDGALRRVVRGPLGERTLRRAGRDVHDGAATRGTHVGNRVLARPVRAGQRDPHDVLERVVVDLVDVAVAAAARIVGDRVVDQRGEAAVAVDGRLHGAGELALDAVVGPHEHRPAAGRLRGLLDLASVHLGATGERDPGALRG